MDSLALKLLLTPALVGTASLAGRRWGPAVGGWFVGFPLTSGPVAFFLAVSQGLAFAAAAAVGTLIGTISQAAFCLAYAWLAFRASWPLALLASLLVFTASTVVLQPVSLPLVPLFFVVVAALVVALYLMPKAPAPAAPPRPSPRWDIPARMVVATGFVLLLTAVAPALGPRLTGLLSPFPLFGAVLAVFAHRLQGPAAGAGVLRGLVLGLFAFGAFFAVLAGLLEGSGIGPAFAAATALTLALQAGALRALRARDRAGSGRRTHSPV